MNISSDNQVASTQFQERINLDKWSEMKLESKDVKS